MAHDGGAGDGWLVSLRNAYAIHNVLAERPELPLFVIRWRGGTDIEWMDLTDPRQPLKPFHFEIHYGKEAQRDAYYAAALADAAGQTGVIRRELFGFSDLFYPLPDDDSDARSFVYAGQFYDRAPTWERLCDQWRLLAEREPASGNPDFAHFVRMALDLPVIGDDLWTALVELIELYGAFITGAADGPDIGTRIDTLNREYFAPLWPVEDWVASAISPDKFHLTPWNLEGGLADWIREGIGVTRLPTTAMALMPRRDRSERLDPVQTVVENARLQRACVRFARSLPETAATRLSDYGVSIITSARSGKSESRARVDLRECADKLQRMLADDYGVRSVVGIGPSLAPGSPLHPSHRQAVLALHMCVQLDKPILFFDEHGEAELPGYASLHRAAGELVAALDRERATEVKAAADRYVQLVLQFASERIEVARGQFLATLFDLLASVWRRHPMSDEARDRFTRELASELERAPSLSAVIDSFNRALSRLTFVSSEMWHGPHAMRLQATLQFIEENLAEPLSLGEAARRAGFSVPAFTRAFREVTGTSFLKHVRGLRVERAKTLLSTTQMTLERVAEACGFHSQHHLIRSFKTVTGQTPGGYRKSVAD